MAQIKNFDEILSDLKTNLTSVIPTAKTTKNSFWAKIYRPIAYILNQNYEYARQVDVNWKVTEATGNSIDNVASNYGITRREAVKATGYLLFTGTAGATIPLGTKAQTENVVNQSPIVFETLVASSIKVVTGTDIAFVHSTSANDTITGSGFTGYAVGDDVYISGSMSNDGVYKIKVVASGVLTLEDGEELTEETAGDEIEISRVVQSQEVVGGDKGSVGANTISVLTFAIAGVTTVTNPLAFTGGVEKEPDGEVATIPIATSSIVTSTLRGRILNLLFNNTGKTTKAGYEQTALTVSGVSSALAISNTINPPDIYVYIASSTGNGIPNADLVTSVQSVMKRDINKDPLDTVTVVAVTGVSINVTYAVTAESQYTTAQKSQLGTLISSELTKYINSLGAGVDVFNEGLDNIVYNVVGVSNFTSSLPTSDTTIANNQKAISGTITITVT